MPTLPPASATVRLALAFALLVASAAAASAAAPPASNPVPPAPWPLTDALGRAAPLAGEANVPNPRADRFVGIFYFLWHDSAGGRRPGGDGPFDVSKILQADPDALHHPDSPLVCFGTIHAVW